jgi:hypothetical protein
MWISSSKSRAAQAMGLEIQTQGMWKEKCSGERWVGMMYAQRGVLYQQKAETAFSKMCVHDTHHIHSN